jgi:ubiquinone/menaquinone biosynthesis C-methylase UbiE
MSLTFVDENRDNFKILDVASGTGALPFAAIDLYKGKNYQILATDFSPAMVSIIQKKITDRQITNIEAKVMDGQVSNCF